MSKKYSHHIWRRLHSVRPWYFLVVAVVAGSLAAYSLRQNNIRMIQLREQVYHADQSNGNTESALRQLREYVYGHMNTDLASGGNSIYPPIQLKYSYDRALTAAQAASGVASNDQIYNDAQKQCEQQFPTGLSGSGRIPCIQSYISSHGLQEATLPIASLYEFDFVSPTWSPDLAGWSLVAATLFAALFVIRWLSDRWLRSELNN